MTIANATITAGSEKVAGTALFVNVPATVKVTGSTLNANYQVVVVRGGNVEVVNSTLNLANTYTEASVEDQMDAWLEIEENSGKTQAEAFKAVVVGNGDTNAATIKEYRVGLTMQQYRMAGLWDQGNGVPRAVVTVGNSHGTSYQYKATFSATASVEVNNATSYPNLVIGSYYGDTLAKPEGTAAVCVTVTVPTTNVWPPTYCSTVLSGTVSFYGAVVNT